MKPGKSRFPSVPAAELPRCVGGVSLCLSAMEVLNVWGETVSQRPEAVPDVAFGEGLPAAHLRGEGSGWVPPSSVCFSQYVLKVEKRVSLNLKHHSCCAALLVSCGVV